MRKTFIFISVLMMCCNASMLVAQQPATVEERLRQRRAVEAIPATGPAVLFNNTLPQRRIEVGPNGDLDISTPSAVRIIKSSWSPVLENATFLGVAGVPVEPALREQLGLKKGLGVLIERVDQDSPAEQAGLKRYDIIEKLDDQLLVNGQQLAILVRTHAPGDEIKLAIIRGGQRQTIPVKLIEKQVPSLDDKNLWGMPGPFGDATTGAAGGVTLRSNVPNAGPLNDLFKSRNVSATIKTVDGNYTLAFTTDDDSIHLLAKDNQGNVVFDGPLDTDDQVKQLPVEITDKVKPILGKLVLMRPKTPKKP